MSTDHVADDVLSEVFARHAEDRPDAQLVLADLHRRLHRRSHISRRPMMAMLATAAAVALVIGASALGNHGTQLSPAASQPTVTSNTGHPGEDQLTKTCLDMDKVRATWGNSSTGYGGVASGDGCSHEADTILPTRPSTVSSVTAGDRTVYIAQSPAGIRTGYLALDPTESAGAAKASGQNWDPNRPYYLIVSIPADNPQSVLVSILEQFALPGH